MDEDKVNRESNAVRSVIEDEFGVSGYDVAVFIIDTGDGWTHEADVPKDMTLDAASIARMSDGIRVQEGGHTFLISLQELENRNLRFTVSEQWIRNQ